MTCFLASFVVASLIPAEISTGMNVPERYLAAYPVIGYTSSESLPERILRAGEGEDRKRILVEVLLPMVLKANERVFAQRMVVERIARSLPSLERHEEETLWALARIYRVEATTREEAVRELLMRVDVLPPSLVLAQAAIESGWGTSRFSHEGNNVFGLRTHTGNGMVPLGRPPEESYAVSRFENLQSCIDYYLWNINTNPLYEPLRRIRRACGRAHDPYELARGLECYSEQGALYVAKVARVISMNDLREYDSYRLR